MFVIEMIIIFKTLDQRRINTIKLFIEKKKSFSNFRFILIKKTKKQIKAGKMDIFLKISFKVYKISHFTFLSLFKKNNKKQQQQPKSRSKLNKVTNFFFRTKKVYLNNYKIN